MIGYWSFDEGAGTTAYDRSGYGNNGTLYNSPTWTTGQVGGALSFDGVNDYVQTTLSSNFLPLTIVVWYKPNVNNGERSIVDSDISGQYGQSIIQGYNTGDNTIDIEYHDGWYNSSFQVNTGTWYFVSGVFISGKISLYVDDNFIGSQTFTQGSLNGDNFRIGRHNAGDPQWFNGLIDEVRIYNRALSDSEIQAIYNATK
jgi:hypothetical protein